MHACPAAVQVVEVEEPLLQTLTPVAVNKVNSVCCVSCMPASPSGSDCPFPCFAQSPIATAFTIEADSDSDEDSRPRHQNGRKPQGSSPSQRRPPLPPPESPTVRRAQQQQEQLEQLRQEEQQRQEQQDNRPPSPRSLLANPRMGQVLISTPTRKQPSPEDFKTSGRWLGS